MTKIKTSELTGAALDWAVAKCEGVYLVESVFLDVGWMFFSFSENWSQGGPIIEREMIDTLYMGDGIAEHYWRAEAIGGYTYTEGPTPLIAAMRCYVASKLDYEVDVPEELL